jgi:hypothetical protein
MVDAPPAPTEHLTRLIMGVRVPSNLTGRISLRLKESDQKLKECADAVDCINNKLAEIAHMEEEHIE